MSGLAHTVGQTFGPLEDRTTPADYFVALRSVAAGVPGQTAATISGSLDLNAAQPSIPGGILVDAASPVEAIRKGLFGRIGVRFNGAAYYYDYGPTTASGNWAVDNTPFYIQAAPSGSGATHVVQLEDRFGLAGCDWDYNDWYWLVDAYDPTNPPPPPPGTVGNSPPYVPGPKLEILDKNGQGLTDGKVAKWQDAYEKTDKVRVKTDFPTTDADRFYLRVTVPYYAANPGQAPQAIQVMSDSDMLTNGLTLTAVSPGVYETRKCVLVSNTVDDEFKVNGINDNALDDATYRVKLGDTQTISYDSNPAGQISRPIIHKRVPVRVLKEVKVHVTVITSEKETVGSNDTTKGYATQAQVNQWLTEANETSAQVGVRLVWDAASQFADQPKKQPGSADEDVILNEDAGPVDNGLKDPSAAVSRKEARGLLRGNRTAGGSSTPLRTASNADVELFFINYLTKGEWNADETEFVYTKDATYFGYAFSADIYGGDPTEGNLVDSTVVSAEYHDPFTVAHEIGHLLTANGSHVEEGGAAGLTEAQVESNLMRAGICLDQIVPPGLLDPDYDDWTTATKRLTNAQQAAIHSQRSAIVKIYIP